MRLALAGARQILQPAFTAKEIFRIADDRASLIVRELGMANSALAIVGLMSLFRPTFVLPAAIAGGLFYGAAGLQHVLNRERTTKETIAMASDIFAFAMLAIFVIGAFAS